MNNLLRAELGPLLPLLEADDVTDITVSASGLVQAETLSGRMELPERLSPEHTRSLISTIAGLEGQIVHEDRPILECMVVLGEQLRVRVEAILPPVAPGPVLCLRRPASVVWSLSDLVQQGTLTAEAQDLLGGAIHDRRSILVAGSTGSGKTTLASALLAEAHPQHLVVCEDGVHELRLPPASRAERLITAPAAGITMTHLVRAALRLNPDRIAIGEVRGPEALDMIRAAITGHPGLCTVHASSPVHALLRLRDLAEEAGVRLPLHRVLRAVDLVVYMTRRGHRRIVSSIFEPDPGVGGEVGELTGRYLFDTLGDRRRTALIQESRP